MTGNSCATGDSSSQGKAEFTMEFARYAAVPADVQTELIEKYQEERAK